MKMRNLGITVISLVLTTIVVGNAYYQKKQFYPSVVYITKSNPSMAVIYIQGFILVILSGKLMRKVFFWRTSTSRARVTETCLAFTVFRDDFSPKFVALFTLLLFLKSFHWLADERVDFMERSPVISWLFHIRIISLLLLLGSLDIAFIFHAYQSTLVKGASVQLVFGFEYAILLTIIMNIVIKYAFHINDFHELPWENKAVFLLYTELVMGFIKVLLYFAFVFIMVRIYTLPLFAFRPMYFTVRAFKKAVNDVIMSRRAINNMNTLYPDATAEELAAADNVCIICREEMHSASKKLPCNHIFHTSCLRSWFQRQQTCPTCRLNILRTPGTPPAPPNQPNPPRNEQQPPPGNFQWMQNAQQANDNTPNNANDRPNQPSGSGPSTSQPQSHGGTDNIPFFRPPPFPYMAFNIPPPMPPSNGLSDEELRQLEQRTREGIEARLRCLQNIQCLLDASVVMMQQYSAAVAASQAYDVYQATTSTREAAKNVETQTSQSSPPSSSKTEPAVSESSSTAGDDIPNTESCSETSEASANLPSGDDTLRLRRLEKFSKK